MTVIYKEGLVVALVNCKASVFKSISFSVYSESLK